MALIIAGIMALPSQAWLQQYLFSGEFPQHVLFTAFTVGFWGVYINLILAFFNLLPFYPLDGEKIVLGMARPEDVQKILEARQYGMYFILGMFALGYFFDIHIVSSIVGPVKSLLIPSSFQDWLGFSTAEWHILTGAVD